VGIQLRAIKGPTGRLLHEMLDEKGLLRAPIQGVVNFGYGGHNDLPTLNAEAGTKDKLQELMALKRGGIPTVPFSRQAADLQAPVFGRRLHHTRGNDIMVYNVRPLLRGDHRSDYYTQLIPKRTEYRVWAFQGKCLATYEKILAYPGKNGRGGRSREVWNWWNGYAYQFIRPEDIEADVKELGVEAVKAVGLDFGAVDIILGTNGRLYALEVNSAPGTEGRRQGLTSLVNCIERWAAKLPAGRGVDRAVRGRWWRR
jgi:hypothetical protein